MSRLLSCVPCVGPPLCVDRLHRQLGVVLAVTLVLLIVLAPAHLEDADLVSASLGDYLGGDRCTGDERLADRHRIAVTDEENRIEHHLAANVCRYRFYLDFLA